MIGQNKLSCESSEETAGIPKMSVSSIVGCSNKFITIPFDDIFHVSLYLDILPMS